MIQAGTGKWWVASACMGFAWSIVAAADVPHDWRLEFLAAEKLASDTESLRTMSQKYQMSSVELERAVVRLGAEKLSSRLQAQNEIILMGKEVLPMIRNLPAAKDPEVNLRMWDIEKILSENERWSQGELLRLAVTGLLHERENPSEVHASQQMFVELFRDPVDSLEKGYRRMHFKGAPDLHGRVEKGVLRLSGERKNDEGDQHLYLESKDIMGKATFPDKFRIDVKLGGEAGGEGSYHIGVAVGNVRALFHPGYETGAFRFQLVDTERFITHNVMMGFDPPVGKMLRMCINVERLAGGKVKMQVVVNDGKKEFTSTEVFVAEVIGKLDRISLDRSGRAGGDALFDDLIVKFSAP